MSYDLDLHEQADAPPSGGIPADHLVDQACRHGFEAVASGDHTVLERDGVRVVLPGRGRTVPDRVVRMLEFGLEPHLGSNWLKEPTPQRPQAGNRAVAGSRTVHVLDAIVDQSAPGEPWCAFLAEDFGVVGYGAERDAALRDLKHAAACRLDVDVDDVVVITPTIV